MKKNELNLRRLAMIHGDNAYSPVFLGGRGKK